MRQVSGWQGKGFYSGADTLRRQLAHAFKAISASQVSWLHHIGGLGKWGIKEFLAKFSFSALLSDSYNVISCMCSFPAPSEVLLLMSQNRACRQQFFWLWYELLTLAQFLGSGSHLSQAGTATADVYKILIRRTFNTWNFYEFISTTYSIITSWLVYYLFLSLLHFILTIYKMEIITILIAQSCCKE